MFTVGHSENFSFNGLVDPGPVVVPGLTAALTLTLNSIVGNQATFAYTLANTSSAPVTDSRVSIFGFNVVGSNKPTSGTATGTFTVIYTPPPPVPILGNRDVCVTINTCAGGAGGGVPLGLVPGNPGSGTFTLNFAAALGTSITIDDLFVRYQSINAPGITGGSGVGVVVPIPEPATWAMLILGFGLVGASLRRRKGTAHVTA